MVTHDLYDSYDFLVEKLSRYFTATEFSDLCHLLSVDPGDLRPGPTPRDRAESLLRLLHATGRHADLQGQLRVLRPTVDWPRTFAPPLSQPAHVYANLPEAGRLPELTALTAPAGPICSAASAARRSTGPSSTCSSAPPVAPPAPAAGRASAPWPPS